MVLTDNGGKATLTLTPATGGVSDLQFFQLQSMLTQLNMTPDFTLDKQTKQKLLAVQASFQKATAKFNQDNQEQLKSLQQEQAQAIKEGNNDSLQAVGKKLAELYAKGPKSGDYVAGLMAALPANQLKVVTDRIKGQGKPAESLYQYDASGGTFQEKRVEEKK